jgi:hypothetical protein
MRFGVLIARRLHGASIFDRVALTECSSYNKIVAISNVSLDKVTFTYMPDG